MNKKNLITTLALAASLVLAAGGATDYCNAQATSPSSTTIPLRTVSAAR